MGDSVELVAYSKRLMMHFYMFVTHDDRVRARQG